MGKRSKKGGGGGGKPRSSAGLPDHKQEATSVRVSLVKQKANKWESSEVLWSKDLTPRNGEVNFTVKIPADCRGIVFHPPKTDARARRELPQARIREIDVDQDIVETSFCEMLRAWPFYDTDMLTSWADEAKNELMKLYRASLARAYYLSTTIVQGPKVTLQWKKEWRTFTKFTRDDHEMSFSVSLCSGMQRLQPVGKEDAGKLLSSVFGRGPVVFLPVTSSFVSLQHLREGVKFVVRDPSAELEALLDSNDYVLFAGGFDVTEAACDAGFLFKESDLIVGVLLCDAYSYFMADLSLNLFTEPRGGAYVVPFSRPEDKYKTSFLYMVSHVLWFGSVSVPPLVPKTRLVAFFYGAFNLNSTVTVLQWETHVPTDCPMNVFFRLFAKRLGESESAFTFHLGKEKKRFDGNLSIGPGQESPTFYAYPKDEKGGLEDFTFLYNGRLSQMALGRVTRLTAIRKWMSHGKPMVFEAKYLVPQDTPLDDIVALMTKEIGRAIGKTRSASLNKASYAMLCRVDDGSLVKVPAALAGNPRDAAEYAGVDPIHVELHVVAPDYSDPHVGLDLPFDRATIDGKMFRACQHVLLWKGSMAFGDDDASANAVTAWISMAAPSTTPEEKEALRQRFETWPRNIKLHPAAAGHRLPFPALNAANSLEVSVTFCPVRRRGQLGQVGGGKGDGDVMAKLRDHTIQWAYFSFSYRDDDESYGVLYFDQESQSFKMRLVKEDTDLAICTDPKSLSAKENTFILGVMTFQIRSLHKHVCEHHDDKSVVDLTLLVPGFAVVFSKEYADVGGLFDAKYSSDQPSHVWLRLEEAAFEKAARKRNLVDGPSLTMDMAGAGARIVGRDQPYLVVAGTAEEVAEVLKRRDHARLAKTMIPVKIVPDQDIVHMLRMTPQAKEWLAKHICQTRPPSVDESLKYLLSLERICFKKPDLAKKWAPNIERAERPAPAAAAASSSTASIGARPKILKKSADGQQKGVAVQPAGKFATVGSPAARAFGTPSPSSTGARLKSTNPLALMKKEAETRLAGRAALDMRKRLAAAVAAPTGVSTAEAIAKLERLRKHISAKILTAEKSSAKVEAIVAEARSEARAEVAASGPSVKRCTFCRREALTMLVCGRCRVTHYCSKKCQTSDWRNHKADCTENHKSTMRDIAKML